MVVFILFVVVMALWFFAALGPLWPAPYARASGLLPWCAVLLLFLLVRHPF